MKVNSEEGVKRGEDGNEVRARVRLRVGAMVRKVR